MENAYHKERGPHFPVPTTCQSTPKTTTFTNTPQYPKCPKSRIKHRSVDSFRVSHNSEVPCSIQGVGSLAPIRTWRSQDSDDGRGGAAPILPAPTFRTPPGPRKRTFSHLAAPRCDDGRGRCRSRIPESYSLLYPRDVLRCRLAARRGSCQGRGGRLDLLPHPPCDRSKKRRTSVGKQR
jgi:hypothetical protein